MSKENIENDDLKDQNDGQKMHRRDILKALATVPAFGAFAYTAYRKTRFDQLRTVQNIGRELGLTTKGIVGLPLTDPQSRTIKI